MEAKPEVERVDRRAMRSLWEGCRRGTNEPNPHPVEMISEADN